eukprot:436210-Alexandrium_andersonii.AAC.1
MSGSISTSSPLTFWPLPMQPQWRPFAPSVALLGQLSTMSLGLLPRASIWQFCDAAAGALA